MMKRTCILLLTVICLVSCEERTPDFFRDITGVYFNNASSGVTLTDSLDLTFVYEASDVMEVPVRIQLIGRASDEDRPLNITVSSENAQENIDYVLPSAPVMPAGAYSMEYVVTLNRTEALKHERKMIELRLHVNEHFTLPVSDMVQVADTVSVLNLRIYFSDMFTKAPSAWEDNLVGEFTRQKFELICRVLEIDPADFNDAGKITLAKLLYISSEMTAYVEGEKQKKDKGEPYDTEAFDEETGEPLTFR